MGPFARILKSAAMYLGPRGGKWADPAHTVAWKDSTVRGQADFVGPEDDEKREARAAEVRGAMSAWRTADEAWRAIKPHACKNPLEDGCRRAYQRLYDSLDTLGRKLNLDVPRGGDHAQEAVKWLRRRGHVASLLPAKRREAGGENLSLFKGHSRCA